MWTRKTGLRPISRIWKRFGKDKGKKAPGRR